MGAFLGISLWVALATVVPGLITIASICMAALVITPNSLASFSHDFLGISEWIGSGFAITIMVFTQLFGILLEKVMVNREWLGPPTREIKIAPGIDPHGTTEFTLRPYVEYQGLYILLAELRDNEDTQGHLKRVLAQYFLTNNTLISILSGILVSVILLTLEQNDDVYIPAIVFILVSILLLSVAFKVAVIRFEVMAKALWAARRRRLGKSDEEYTYLLTTSQVSTDYF